MLFRHAIAIGIGLALALPAPAVVAEVSVQPPNGFTVIQRIPTQASPAELVPAIGRISDWWGDTHTYSRHAENLRVDLQAGGCFCERWAASSVEHARIIYVDRDVGMVRMAGSLGPLQPLAVTGLLSFSIQKTDDKNTLIVSYRIGAADAGTLERWPSSVDLMIRETAEGLARYLSTNR